MTAPPIVVPAPTFRHPGGELDHDTTSRYAHKLAASWAPHIIVSGPMGRGEHATVGERGVILDLWLQHIEPNRLVATCWTAYDVRVAQLRQVRPLVMLAADTATGLADQLDHSPADGWVYANPRYSRALLTAELVAAAGASGVKLSKVDYTELRTMRTANQQITIVHGSSRNIAASLTAGADLVTASPLAALPSDFPAPDLGVIQRRADTIQQSLDELLTHHARVKSITARAVDGS